MPKTTDELRTYVATELFIRLAASLPARKTVEELADASFYAADVFMARLTSEFSTTHNPEA